MRRVDFFYLLHFLSALAKSSLSVANMRQEEQYERNINIERELVGRCSIDCELLRELREFFEKVQCFLSMFSEKVQRSMFIYFINHT